MEIKGKIIQALPQQSGVSKQGDAANAEQIKAAFEAKGYHTGSWDYGDELFFFFSMNNGHIRAQRLPASNKDTKHLLGTTDMPSEEFINW